MSQPLLSGEVNAEYVDSPDVRIDKLEREVASLRRELEAMGSAIIQLRHQLAPLDVLRQAFGGAVVEDTTPTADTRIQAVWHSWKQKLGGSCGKVIDALLLHGEMNTRQLAIAVGLHRTTIPALIYKLNQAGLINKNGGRFSLKQL